MTAVVRGSHAGPAPIRPVPRGRPGRHPGWPVTALFMLYPLWWALGMGTLIVYVLAVPMALELLRRRPIIVPPGFGLWLLFLVCDVASLAMLGYTPPGTLAKSVLGRAPTIAFDLVGYLAVTIVLLYVVNLPEELFPRKRLVRQLGALFCTVVAGGLLGVLVPHLQFRSPVERLLPAHVAANQFVRSLVHPAVAQLQDVLGFVTPRPAAPFGYTNTWGNCVALLLGFFVVSWLRGTGTRRRLTGLAILALATVPVVYSLNRGLWVALGLAVVFMVLRLAVRGRLAALGGLLVALLLGATIFVLSPLGGVITDRLAHPHSNNIRAFTVERTLSTVDRSPVLGFGSTRAVLGSSNSIAVGKTASCQTCGNPVLGSTGEIWSILVAHGYLGALCYVGFLLRSAWVYRRDHTPIGDAALLAILLTLWCMFVYDALVMPLVITFMAVALLWRNHQAALVPGQDLAAEPSPGALQRKRSPRWPAGSRS